MSAYKPGSDWHYIQNADENAFRSAKAHAITCNQPVNFYNNQVEQVAVALLTMSIILVIIKLLFQSTMVELFANNSKLP